MKKHDFGKPLCRLIMAVAMMMLSLQAMAYDFFYTYQGKTLYYNITSDSTVEVTYYSDRVSANNYVNGDVVIPSSVEYNGATYSVTSIGWAAFGGCSGLTSVTIPNSVTSIGSSAFYDCSGLTSVTIPTGVTSIGYCTFYGCSGLTSITIPTGVTYIGNSAFCYCSGLTSVTIGNSVTSIGERAFYGCSSLTTLNFNAINCQYVSSLDYSTFGTSLTTVNIGDSVRRIPAYFVSGCSGLTSVTIPNSVTSIGNSAFYDCRGLTSVTIPTGVTSIGEQAFYGCSGLTTLNFNAIDCQGFEEYYNNGHYYYPFSGTSLTTVNIGDSVQRIPENFVRDCRGLTSVTIPNSVTSIGGFAFEYCSGLTTLNFNAINCQDFNYCPFIGTSLTTVNIGDSVQRIPAYFVSGCSGLTSITIPNSVTSIGGSAFRGCSGLTSITIPNSVTSIGEEAFRNCRGLTSVRCLASAPPSIGSSSFAGISSTCTLTVSCVSFDAYVGSDWNTYFGGRILEDSTEEFSFELTASANDLTAGSVDISIGERCDQRILTATPESCYRFNAWSDGNRNNPRIITLTQDTAFTAYFDRAVYTQEIRRTICEGTSYTENGFNVSEAGTYTQNLQTVNGCDSIVTLTLTVNPVESTTLLAAICEGTSYTENGFNVSEAGTYTQNLQTIDGCDSIVTLTLTVNPTYNITIDASINEGEMYEENGFSESEAGTYVHTLQSEFGCDSVITLNLTVNSSLNDVVANAVEVRLYPNPAKSFVTLEFEALKENTLLQILDLNGRKVRTFDLKAGIETLRIDLGDLPKGVYTVMIGNVTKKLIVE